ncbi:50S ribosomal protein L15 [Candidatus Dojkabacteria bacterium]|nr:50S ribosomal protein L15 [Candidatus Dojkabacteria bacterium]
MLEKLNKIKTKSRKRVGRGYGSGKGGHTVGRGQKGQKSRAGYKKPRPDFEGGSMPLSRRIPKLKGFSRGEFVKAKKILLGLDDLQKFEGDVVSPETLEKSGLISSKSQNLDIKIVANGELKKKLTIKGIDTSKTARAAIEKAGGKIEA